MEENFFPRWYFSLSVTTQKGYGFHVFMASFAAKTESVWLINKKYIFLPIQSKKANSSKTTCKQHIVHTATVSVPSENAQSHATMQ